MSDERSRFGHEDLRRTVEALLIASGMPAKHASATAAGLIRADLRGVETHGVSNMLRNYMQWLNKGECSRDPQVRTLWQRGALKGVDSDRGIGLAILPDIVSDTIELARTFGIAAVSVSNGRHAGMMAHHALLIAEAGMIGLALTATSPRVVPTRGRDARLGTNPIAIAAPAADGRMICFDAATSAVAGNRVTNALRTKGKITRASVVEADGTVNATAIDAHDGHLRRLAPMGGLEDEASHKGYGLAVLVELLCGTMIDDGGLPERVPGGATHFICAIAPGAVDGRRDLAQNVMQLADYLSATAPARGKDRVLYPGEKETREEQYRRQNGVPLHDEVVTWFGTACREHGLTVPEPIAKG